MDVVHNTGNVRGYGSLCGVTKEKTLFCISCVSPFPLLHAFHAWCIGTEEVKRRPRALIVSVTVQT